jgi:hypothetical protein
LSLPCRISGCPGQDDPAAEELLTHVKECMRDKKLAILKGKRYLIRKGPEIEETEGRVVIRVEGIPRAWFILQFPCYKNMNNTLR